MKKPDYWYWKNIVPKNHINEINEFIDTNCDSEGVDEDSATYADGSPKKNNIIKTIFYGKIKPYADDFINLGQQANRQHFGYAVDNKLPDDKIILNIYNSEIKGSYDWHKDSDQLPYRDIKLTMLINLSDKEYSGGEFMMFLGYEKVIKEFSSPGDVIMFRSNIYHAVKPVTQGQRKTLALFLTGPAYK